MQFVLKILENSRKLNVIRNTKMFAYPKASRDENVVDDFFGTLVNDPYRWLEDPDSEETKQFVTKQNAITEPYLKGCPFRELIKNKIVDMWDYPKFSTPLLRGNNYFQVRNSGLENQGVLYVAEDINNDGIIFIDPNRLAADGTVALGDIAISENNEICAYSLNAKGSDWTEIKFKNVMTGQDYGEVLKKVKFSSMAWTHDNVGLFYGAYIDQQGKTDGSETNQVTHQKLYYHRLGTDQSKDILVVEFDNPEYLIGAKVSHCGKYLIVTPSKGCKNNLVYYCELPKEITGNLKITPLVEEFVADFSYLTNNGTQFLFHTDKNASNGKIISIDIKTPNEDNWRIIVPEHEHNVLNWGRPVDKDKLVLCYLRDVKHMLQLYDLSSGQKLHDFQIGMGSIESATGRRQDSQMFYGFTSFLTPKIVQRIKFDKGELINDKIQETKINNETFVDQFETKQVFYKSKDATNIPMFLIYKKGMELNGKNPCLLYGYGGFNINVSPRFSLAWLIFARHFKGIVAVANIRGGGEYGDKWHTAGRLDNKQNCFDDFQFAARYLIGCGYTSADKLAIEGASNGGLLIAACINQSPELFGAAIAHVGVMDMLRFHKFTIGYAWKTDYGSSEDPAMFNYLMKYSPLHNVSIPSSGQYPATLLLTADHDDRVVPLHSLKYIAELQHKVGSAPNQKNPLLIRVETKAGHGAGKPTSKKIDELTDVFCFISNALNIPFYE